MARRIIAGKGLEGGGDVLSQDRELRLAPGGTGTTELADGSVTNAKLADMAQSTIKGRAEGAGTGDPQDLTPAQVRGVAELSSGDYPTFFGLLTSGSFNGGDPAIGTVFDGTQHVYQSVVYFNDDSAHGPILFLQRVSASPAANDGLSQIVTAGRNSADEFTVYGTQEYNLLDPTDGAEYGRYGVHVLRNGVLTEHFALVDADAFFPSLSTTASAANAFLDDGNFNRLLRSTSARRAKREIAALVSDDGAKALALQPVAYKSALPADDQTQVHIGLIAEDVAAIDPRLVQWGYHDDQYDEQIIETPQTHKVWRQGKDGKPEVVDMQYMRRERKRTLKPGAVKSPVNVAYDRLAVLLLSVIQAQEARIAALETRLQP